MAQVMVKMFIFLTGALILDEIQYAPKLVPVLKRLIDENRLMANVSDLQQFGRFYRLCGGIFLYLEQGFSSKQFF